MKQQLPTQLRGYLDQYLTGEKSRKNLLDWSLIVGKALSDVSALVQVGGGTVVVWADSDSVRRELHKLEGQILALLLRENSRKGKLVVVLGKRPEPDRYQGDSATRARGLSVPGKKHNEQEKVRKACEGIEDEELRTMLETFLSWEAPKGGER